MAFNYYEGWKEAELLTERKILQKNLMVGRTTEIRLAGELTRTDDRGAAPLELTLRRISYALFVGMPWESGNTYADPEAVITIQSHY